MITAVKKFIDPDTSHVMYEFTGQISAELMQDLRGMNAFNFNSRAETGSWFVESLEDAVNKLPKKDCSGCAGGCGL